MTDGRAAFTAALSFLILVPAIATAAGTPPPLQVTLRDRAVTVANVTTGARVVLFTASLTTHDSRLLERTGARVFTDDDRDGTVTYTRPEPIPLRSVWIAVDIESGRYAVATPSGFPSPLVDFPARLLKRDADGTRFSFGV